MNKHTLEGQPRELSGRKVRRLRADGILPATLYGKKIDSLNVQVSEESFLPVYKEVGETGLVELMISGKKHPVLISNIQIHPVTGSALHIDFREVDLTEKVKAAVPVELVGESPAEKQGIGTLVLMVNELEVEALPTDLPEKFEIDATALAEVDQVFTVADLKFDKSKIVISADAEQTLAKVEPPQKEEVVEAPVAAEGETPTEAAPAQEGSTEEKPQE